MFKLPKLPFEKDALEPFISEETINYHYWKHHQAYVDNTNNLIKETEFENKSLEEIIKNSTNWLFNNSAQIWNHNFYWNCLTPNFGEVPSWKILDFINRDFWSFDEFKEKFTKNALWNFGSGWTWLVKNPEWKLEIVNTSNAETIITTKNIPILVIDIWEHAYYIDTRNARPKYVENYWNVVNWNFVNENLEK